MNVTRFVLATGLCTAAISAAMAADGAASASIERGRYLVKITGCNDCHTPGYAQSGGKTPESGWLVGDRLGWQGPWGTTYPSNLRIAFGKMTEKEWLKTAATNEYRPPMPGFTLKMMKPADLRDIYRFIRSLGPAGEAAPAYVPPGKDVQGPVVRYP